MAVVLVLAHPKSGSLNHAIAETAHQALGAQGYAVIFHDLYAEGFDPLLTPEELDDDAQLDPVIRRHCDELREAEGVVIVHPNWWGKPPAMMTGYVDRVFRRDVVYDFPEGDDGGGVPIGLLKAKTALVFNTSNTPPTREDAVFGDPLERIWKNCIFDMGGVPNFGRKMFRVVASSSEEDRRIWLDEVQKMVTEYFPVRS
jgi:NAD(P)H dehydrogenase (quinone)